MYPLRNYFFHPYALTIFAVGNLISMIIAHSINPDILISSVGLGPNSPFFPEKEMKTGISPMTLTTPLFVLGADILSNQFLPQAPTLELEYIPPQQVRISRKIAAD